MASGGKRCLPCLLNLLMQLREERHWSGAQSHPGTNHPTASAWDTVEGSSQSQCSWWPWKTLPSALNPIQHEEPPQKGAAQFPYPLQRTKVHSKNSSFKFIRGAFKITVCSLHKCTFSRGEWIERSLCNRSATKQNMNEVNNVSPIYTRMSEWV